MRKINLKIKVIFIIGVIAMTVVAARDYGVLYSKQTNSNNSNEDNISQQMRLFTDAFMLVKENYVEEINAVDLVHGAIKGMIGALDPYSQFMEPDISEVIKEDTEGEFGGLGIRITTQDGYITVITPLPDTPAYRKGIQPGDKIVKIEGESAEGISVHEAVQKLRGPEGSEVNISVAREGEEELLEFDITRGRIVPKKVYKKILDKKIGYIRLVEFTDDAPQKLEKTIKDMMEQNIEGLIVDLRNNPGGLLSSAVEIADMFLKKDSLIVYTEGRRQNQNREFHSRRKPITEDLPLAVLINKGSASGAEILAGSIKDLSRGILLGDTSFGKASVQSLIDLEDGSGIKLTTAHYYTPSGNKIHGQGIEPDIEVEITQEERKKIAESQQIIYDPDSEEEEKESHKIEDPQLKRARDILIAREIFLKNGVPEELVK
ncbi:MAG: S41 family peptidase [Elusimicrobiota bacterium]